VTSGKAPSGSPWEPSAHRGFDGSLRSRGSGLERADLVVAIATRRTLSATAPHHGGSAITHEYHRVRGTLRFSSETRFHFQCPIFATPIPAAVPAPIIPTARPWDGLPVSRTQSSRVVSLNPGVLNVARDQEPDYLRSRKDRMRRPIRLSCDNAGRQPAFGQEPGRRQCTGIQIDRRRLFWRLFGVRTPGYASHPASSADRPARVRVRRESFVSLVIEGRSATG
jgi:hypothetical protein